MSESNKGPILFTLKGEADAEAVLAELPGLLLEDICRESGTRAVLGLKQCAESGCADIHGSFRELAALLSSDAVSRDIRCPHGWRVSDTLPEALDTYAKALQCRLQGHMKALCGHNGLSAELVANYVDSLSARIERHARELELEGKVFTCRTFGSPDEIQEDHKERDSSRSVAVFCPEECRKRFVVTSDLPVWAREAAGVGVAVGITGENIRSLGCQIRADVVRVLQSGKTPVTRSLGNRLSGIPKYSRSCRMGLGLHHPYD